MMTLVWIDDLRNPKDYIDPQKYETWWIRGYSEFVEFLDKNDVPDIIWFDHDLGPEKSGYDCAKYLIEFCQLYDCDLPEYYCQSQNPVGKENILGLLDSYRRFRKENKKW